jgi:hypothetical protein
MTLSESASHIALWHYRGGRPVPRATSYHDGSLHTHAIVYANVWFFSTHLAFSAPYNNQTAAFCSQHPFG